MATTPNMKSQDMASAVQKVLANVDAARKTDFQFLQKAMQGKAAQLAEEAKAAKAAPAALKSQIAYYTSMNDAVGAMSTYESHLPVPKPGTFVIQGRVTDAKGRGVKKLQLKITDPQGTLKGIQPVTSDSQGYFTLTLRSAEFPELAKNKTDLFLTVTDASGKEVFKPSEAVHLEPGKVATFNLITPK